MKKLSFKGGIDRFGIIVVYGHLPEIQQQGVIQISSDLRRMVTIYERRPDLVLSAFHATLKICFDRANDRGFSDGIPHSVTVAALTLFSSGHLVHETRLYHHLSANLLFLLPFSLRKDLSVSGGSATFIAFKNWRVVQNWSALILMLTLSRLLVLKQPRLWVISRRALPRYVTTTISENKGVLMVIVCASPRRGILSGDNHFNRAMTLSVIPTAMLS
jgi:hypothetical protein